MQVITILHLVRALRHVALDKSVNPASLVEISRDTFFTAAAGQAINSKTAQKLIEAARRHVSPEITVLVDGKGRKHFAPDFQEQAEAELTRLRSENARLWRIARTRFLTSL